MAILLLNQESVPFIAECILLYGYHNLLIHSPVNGHVGYFQSRAMMNTYAVNILVQAFCGYLFSFLLGRHGICRVIV